MKTKLTAWVAPVYFPTLALPTAWLARYTNLVSLLEVGNYRLGMEAAMLIIQGNVIAPISLLIFQYYDFGYQDYFAGIAAFLFFGVLVANLALLPVRTTLAIFWSNIAVHIGLIIWHFV